MKNFPLKIIGLDFGKNCPKELIEPAKKYFELNEYFEFIHKPTLIQNEFNLDSIDMRELREQTKIEYQVFCKNCDSWKTQSANSQTKFNTFVFDLKRYQSEYKCQDCLYEHKKREQEEIRRQLLEKNKIKEKEHQKLVKKLNYAIDIKAWRGLTSFQFEVLKDCLSFDFFDELKQYYWDKNPTPHGFKKLFNALRVLASENLIITETKFDRFRGYDIITNYKYLERLKSEFEYNFELKDNSEDKNNPKQKNSNKDCSKSLKLRLTINDYNNHPDSPLYAGTIRFKEKIVIHPDVDYTFAQWERSNNELYFTLVPTSEIEKLPVQKTLSQEPKAVQEHITSFLNNIKIEK